MRDVFHLELRRLTAELSALCGRSNDAMTKATRALLGRDLTLSEHVITDDIQLGRAHTGVEETACSMLALQSPVAGELRAVVGMLEVAERVRRMGGLACHVAVAARRRHPLPVVPEPLERRIAEMGQIGVYIGRQVCAAVEDPATVKVAELDGLDDRVDELEMSILTWARGGPCEVSVAVDLALLARYFERYADQGVGAARSLHYVATGQRLRAESVRS
jgi:phosphate transport system protein